MAQTKIRLAILDDYQGIGPSKFQHLESAVDVVSFSDTLHTGIPEERDLLINRLHPFDVISTMRERTVLPAEIIEALPNLKLVLTTGMKNTAIDMSACARRGIPVLGAKGLGINGLANSPTSLDSTLEHTWALILALARNVARDDANVKQGGWEQSFTTGLRGKILGLLGFGKLGAEVARVASLAFGMKILAWSSNLTQGHADEKAQALSLPEGVFQVVGSKEDLVRNADVLSIHYVLSERSRNIIGARELALMKPTALLINTSRGPLVNEHDLLSTLKQGNIGGAAIDVHNVEPLPKDSEWRITPWGQDGRSKVLLSPHMGYVEEGVMSRWYEDSAANLGLWLEGKSVPTKLN
ncbi:hypothetical protein AAEP93_009532 [Penicillium crustosum]